MRLKKWKALVFVQIALASNFILFGFMFYNEIEYRNIILLVCSIGFLACVSYAISIYRKNKTKP